MQILGKLLILVPPLHEQDAILTAVALETQRLVSAISGAQREINLLREYRTRLIADVVTGKLDVREATATLPDEANEREEFDGAEVVADGDEMAEDADLEVAIEEA